LQPAIVHARLDVVVGKALAANGPAVQAALEALGRSPVQPAAPDGIQFFVEHFADLVMREGERLVSARDEQLRGDGFVERVQECVLVKVACRFTQLAEIEGFAEYRRRTQGLIGSVAHAIETTADSGFHALGQLKVAHRTVRPSTVLAPNRALLDERLQHFFNKKRVALGLLMKHIGEAGTEILSEQGGELRARVGRPEPLERDSSRQALTIPFDEGFRERMSPIELAFPVRGDK
jgi:hypothetical protein